MSKLCIKSNKSILIIFCLFDIDKLKYKVIIQGIKKPPENQEVLIKDNEIHYLLFFFV